MNLKLVLFSAACLSFFVIPAAGVSLLAAAAAPKGAVIGAGLTGAVLSSASGSETVVIQAEPGSIAVEAVPAQEVQVAVHKPVVQYSPVHPISLIPVATISSSNSIADKLSSVWDGISNVISSKTRAVGDFFRSFRGPPRIVLISVNKTTTTTTTKKPKTTTHQPVVLEVVGYPHQRVYPYQVPVQVLEDFDQK